MGPSGSVSGDAQLVGRISPKPDGRQRPLAVAALEDKIVQRATTTALNALFTRKTSSASAMGSDRGAARHDAMDALVVGNYSQER